MKHRFLPPLLVILLTLAALPGARAQVGIGTTAPDPKAALDISAPDKGLLIPRMDSSTRTRIVAPPDGLLVFQTDGRKGFWYAIAGAWVFIPDKARAGDNLGTHTATQPIQYTTNDTDKIYFTQGGGANGSKLAHSAGWGLDYYAGPNNAVAGVHRFLTGTASGWTEKMRIGANGNVGIGTATPGATLDVAGTVRAQQFSYATAQTHYLSIPGEAFSSNNPAAYQAQRATQSFNGGFVGLATYLSGGTAGQPGYLSAPVNLPQGAVITGISLIARD